MCLVCDKFGDKIDSEGAQSITLGDSVTEKGAPIDNLTSRICINSEPAGLDWNILRWAKELRYL